MNSTLKVLVTAAGGDLAQAAIKALRLSGYTAIYGAECDKDSIAEVFVDKVFRVPRADASNYSEELEKICSVHKIDAVVPCNESEITRLLTDYQSKKLRAGTHIIALDPEDFFVFGDKLKTMQKLHESNVVLAKFADGSCKEDVSKLLATSSFPYIVKSRLSSGSKSIKLVKDKEALFKALDEVTTPIVQEYIDEQYGEFSAGVFASSEFIRVIAFKRSLGGFGATWYAETSFDPEVLAYAKDVAKASGIKGSFNVQFRKSSKGCRLLEINARFSSLVAARARAGFTDLTWAIEASFNKLSTLPDQFHPLKFRRFFHEVIDEGEGYYAPSVWAPHSVRR